MTGVDAPAAARDNAEWCHRVCRSHGVHGRFDPDAWVSTVRTPPLYPDAVTLVRGADAGSVVARVDASAGCSIKDSYSDLDLVGRGFDILFEASWIARRDDAPAPVDASGLRWAGVAEDLADWATAWGADDRTRELFRPSLLDDGTVTIVAGRDGDAIVAGAVLSRSATGVGVSNIFATPGVDPWPGVVATAGRRFPGVPLLGYEQGPDLEPPLEHGFQVLGPLRVWRTA